MAKPDVLLFDFGGTLDHPSHWRDRFVAGYRQAGIDIDRPELAPAYDEATRAALEATAEMATLGLGGLVGFLLSHQMAYLERKGPPKIQSVLSAAGESGRADLRAKIGRWFVAETASGLRHSRRILLGLRPNFRMAVVSNAFGNLDTMLEEAEIHELFEVMVDSSRVGIIKPDPAIFELVLDTLETAPNRVAMVGDTIDNDLAPAHRLGITTVWLRRSEGHALERFGPEAIRSVVDYRIQDLEELPGLGW